MNNSLYTFALIKAYYDAGKDYIDSFWPFVVNSIKQGETLNYSQIQEKVQEEYSLFIPIHSLKTIATRAKRSGYLTQTKGEISLTSKGELFSQRIEVARDVERRINNLISHCKKFLSAECNIDINISKLKTVFQQFLKTNIELIEKYLGGNEEYDEETLKNNGHSDIDNSLLKFIITVENEDPTLYTTLKEMISGSIISSILSVHDISKVTENFQKLEVYLDSNLLISILGLDIDEVSKPSIELFELLQKDTSIQLRVFDFTLDEISRVIQNYYRFIHKFTPKVKVRSLYSKLNELGWTKSKAREFIVNLEDNLRKKGILIKITSINCKNFKSDNPSNDEIDKYKPNQGKSTINHDLAAISCIKEIRGKKQYRLRNCKAIFLTSDKKLANYNYIEEGHQQNSTIAEVIPDCVMTNILWLKNPSFINQVSLESIVSLFSQNLFVDLEIWDCFFNILNELRLQGDINEKDIAILLYDSSIQDELENKEINEITSSWVIAEIDKVKDAIDEENERRINEIRSQSKSEVMAYETKIIGLINQIKQSNKEKAIKQSPLIIRIIGLFLFGSLIFFSFKLSPWIESNWNWIEPNSWIFEIIRWFVIPFIGIRIDRTKIISDLKDILANKLYNFYNRRSNIMNLISVLNINDEEMR